MVYDDVLNITWTRQAGDGVIRGWGDSSLWAANLVLGGYDDWRLPWGSVSAQAGPVTSLVNCASATQTACRDNELGYMFFYNLGGTFGQDATGTQTAVGGEVLTGIQPLHWSGTAFDPNIVLVWWGLFYGAGNAGSNFTGATGAYAWAVRDGDVAVAAIPEPEIYAMMLAGLGLLGWAGRRKKLKQATTV
jgi:hypothetical protein